MGTLKERMIHFSKGIGIQKINLDLFNAVEESFKYSKNNSQSLINLIELSFVSTRGIPTNTLRYVINLETLEGKYLDKILRTVLSSLGDLPGSIDMNEFRKKDMCSLYGVGVEHNINGTIDGVKSYWRFKGPMIELKKLLPNSLQNSFQKFMNESEAFWPEWKGIKLVGIDYLSLGKNRFKIYLPQKDFNTPMSLVDLFAFILKMGWQINVEVFSKISYFLLSGQTSIFPTAYTVGYAMGDKPSLKLEIAAKAYFKNIRKALNAALNLSQSLELNPSVLLNGFNNLEKYNLLNRSPNIEVICIDFYPEGYNRITLYCRP